MTPAMAGNLVAVSNHALVDCWIACGNYVDLSLSAIDAHSKEGNFDSGSLQRIQKGSGVDIRPVVESECYRVRFRTGSYDLTVWYSSECWTRYICCAYSCWDLVRITSRSIGI
jgi:hypothetical protein